MSLSLSQSFTAVAPHITASFYAAGGTAPLVYSVRPGGAGGSINSSTGVYTAPSSVSPNASQSLDVIQVRDNTGAIATASILVTTPLGLVCDILQNQLQLQPGHLYFWDQLLFQPTDEFLYIAVSVPSCKPFGNNLGLSGSGSGLTSFSMVNMYATVTIDAISRGPSARDQKEQILMALASNYSEQQQEANSFYISRLTTSFINLSSIDGAAIPYRYQMSFAMQYGATGSVQINYFDSFGSPQVTVNA